jgi:hypothetical protein
MDVNNFINYEIECCYKKIEFQLKRKVEYVKIMEEKADRINSKIANHNPAGIHFIKR